MCDTLLLFCQYQSKRASTSTCSPEAGGVNNVPPLFDPNLKLPLLSKELAISFDTLIECEENV